MTHPVDIFDVYNDFSYIEPVPVLEAIAAFRKFHQERMKHFSTHDASLYVGEDAYERRKADRERWDKLREEAEILLFRGIVAQPND